MSMKMYNMTEEKLLELIRNSELEIPLEVEAMAYEVGNIEGSDWAFVWVAGKSTIQGLRDAGIENDLDFSAFCVKLKIVGYAGEEYSLKNLIGKTIKTDKFNLFLQTSGKSKRVTGLGFKSDMETLKKSIV
ncbi:Uncharacterised protein [Streptococcus pneumoniae]|nr:Uncharacterised protein [Streptococcus pneumoniae]CYK53007.1 Uncharacterised protein [Streptococcus pneumoniae]